MEKENSREGKETLEAQMKEGARRLDKQKNQPTNALKIIKPSRKSRAILEGRESLLRHKASKRTL